MIPKKKQPRVIRSQVNGQFLLLVVILNLLLSFPGTVLAHGGEGGDSDSTVVVWMEWLIYSQLFLAPFIGLWLARTTYYAWRHPRKHKDPSGG